MGLLFFISALLTYGSFVQGQASCGKGQCKSIYQCPPLLALLSKPQRTQQEVQALKSAQCGNQGGIPQVCCPSECFTPETTLGYCISIYSCPALSKLLTPPVSKENLALVQNSRCDGPEQFSVCCSYSETPKPVTLVKDCVLTAAPPDPKTPCCGLESDGGNRVYGGNDTNVEQYPWLTVIEYKQGKTIRLLCGGALISGKYVVTAGHCILGTVLRYGSPVNVRLGEYDTAHDGPDCIRSVDGVEYCTDGAVIKPIEKTIPHPDYDPDERLRRNDIALIRLKETVQFTEYIRPICLPTSDRTINQPKNFTLWVAGWGATNETTYSSNVKRHVDLPFQVLGVCQSGYNALGRNVSLWNRQLCAGGVQGQDSCKGDSGGPLMYKQGDIWEMTGVVSFGPTPCGIENLPGVYTNLYQYLPWIRSQIKP